MGHAERDADGSVGVRELRAALLELGQAAAPADLAPAVLAAVGLTDAYWPVETAIGPVYVAANRTGVAAVLPAADGPAFERAFRARFGRAVVPAATPPPTPALAVARRLAGERGAPPRFDLRGLSDFERAVLAKTAEIPRGEVRPYGWVAREIGRPGAGRAVGSALGRNPVPLLIPCHRVTRGDGRTGDYVFGPAAKRALLAAEGAAPDHLEGLAAAGVRLTGSDTTHIFCHPTCRNARRTTDRHLVRFASAAEATAAGFRPCLVCRPA